MEMLTIMGVSSAMKDKTKCYIKLVCENYYSEVDEDILPRIHLVFLSKQDYRKISDIEKMIKRYFELEEKYLKTEKKFIIYYYLKEMIRQLKEYDVMEVFSDHIDAFHLEFNNISEFLRIRLKHYFLERLLVNIRKSIVSYFLEIYFYNCYIFSLITQIFLYIFFNNSNIFILELRLL